MALSVKLHRVVGKGRLRRDAAMAAEEHWRYRFIGAGIHTQWLVQEAIVVEFYPPEA
jgi:hypothetical protein